MLNLYDVPIYDATFGLRQLQIAATRQPTGYAVTYNFKPAWQSQEWFVPDTADIGKWLLKDLHAIEWPRRAGRSD